VVSFLNWSGIPDVAAIALLICAFASVARHSQTPASKLWLKGWMMILFHFAAGLFISAPGIWGSMAFIILSASLACAGLLFMHSTLPYYKDTSSHWMLASLLTTNTFYFAILYFGPEGNWALNLAAVLLGLCPLAITLASIRRINHPLRWTIVSLYGTLSIFLLIFQHRPGNGPDLAWDAVMFTAYLGCCIFISYAYRRATAGAFVTVAGFFSWASVFVVAPMMEAFRPQAHIESEVWNLPKYVVAAGMMLLLLEDQIEHNKHLALHDALTGLPNRRLFEDRMTSALERSRRTGTEMALLVVDLNSFKLVNDTLGHHVGDLVLQHVASAFAERVRRSDTVSRTGGDEFSVILEEPTNREEAEHVGRSLRQLLDDPLDLENHKVSVGASIGIAIFPEDASDAESLCIAADLRMYEAKRSSHELDPDAASARQKSIPVQKSTINEQVRLA
jgi:diguanylate cyclase (GGDEF)-like protein